MWPGFVGSGHGGVNIDIVVYTCAGGRRCCQSVLLVRKILSSVPPSGDLLLTACFGAIFSIWVHTVLVELRVELLDEPVDLLDELIEVSVVVTELLDELLGVSVVVIDLVDELTEVFVVALVVVYSIHELMVVFIVVVVFLTSVFSKLEITERISFTR